MKIIDIKIGDSFIAMITEDYECINFSIDCQEFYDFGLTFNGDYLIHFENGEKINGEFVSKEGTFVIPKPLAQAFYVVSDDFENPKNIDPEFDIKDLATNDNLKVTIADILTKMIVG